MAIPKHIKIKQSILPQQPGVYIMKDVAGNILYVGKATSLKSRVESYFTRPASNRIAEMVTQITAIDWHPAPTALDALLLEARLIKEYMPPYNVLGRDSKSFLYVVFIKEDFPRPLLIRLPELRAMRSRGEVWAEFGPFLSAASLRAGLDILRKSFPWCEKGPSNPEVKHKKFKACFYYHIKQCPGVCVGVISKQEYKKGIRQLVQFFQGKRKIVERAMERDMNAYAANEDFERAATVRNRLESLRHIRDMGMIKRDFYEDVDFHALGMETGINMAGRIEAYDISNIGGKHAVGSMVVFQGGVATPTEHRIFNIRSVKGANDVASLKEVLIRRFAHVPGGSKDAWPMPELILIDGGLPQLHAAQTALNIRRVHVPIMSLAKGIDRKGVTFFHRADPELDRIGKEYKDLLVQLRDESHRFAIAHYRKRHRKSLISKKK